MRPYVTEWSGIQSVVLAATASKARYITYKSAREANYDPKIPEIKVRSAPEYASVVLAEGKCNSMDTANSRLDGMAEIAKYWPQSNKD